MTNTAPPRLWDLSRESTQSRARSLVTDALVFASTHIEHLEDHARHWDDNDDPYVSPADKVVVETALLALIASRVPTPSRELRAILDTLAGQLVPCARSERNQVLLMRFPHTAASLGIAHVILTCLGHEDEAYDYLFRRALNSEPVGAIERLPYRSMDLRWLRGLACPDKAADVEDLLPHSILTSGAHPVHMSTADTYVLTHSLMYATDFGTHPLPASVDRDRVTGMVDAGIAFHLLTENLDLLGELLLGAAMLGNLDSPAFRLGWHVMVDVWSELGFLPSPTFDRSTYAALDGAAASAYAFRHVYHTTYVGGILGAVALATQAQRPQRPSPRGGEVSPELLARCQHAVALALAFCRTRTPPEMEHGAAPVPPGDPDSAPGSDGAAASRLDVIRHHVRAYNGACGRPEAMWAQPGFDTVVDRDTLASLLSDALLTQSARDYDLATLARVMTDTARLGLPVSATLIEATTFLLCQQMPSGAIGAHFVVSDNRSAPAAAAVTAGLAQSLAAVARRLDEEIQRGGERAARSRMSPARTKVGAND
jgi:hypothetical protein